MMGKDVVFQYLHRYAQPEHTLANFLPAFDFGLTVPCYGEGGEPHSLDIPDGETNFIQSTDNLSGQCIQRESAIRTYWQSTNANISPRQLWAYHMELQATHIILGDSVGRSSSHRNDIWEKGWRRTS